jgi:predicted Zn-dependent peptidase
MTGARPSRAPRPHGPSLALSTLLLLAPALAAAQAQPPEELQIPVERRTLDNGLRVVLSPDPSIPVVSVTVYYDVGSRNEVQGRSGFAHLFEHMMFQGSENVGKMDHFQLVNAAGGSANGTTSSDRTNYYQTLPSNQLSLGLWLEADRMRALDVTEENFENQRRVVINEYRQSYENQPYGLAFLRINALAFGDYFPYANPTIGTVTDLNGVTWQDARSFYQSWYAPNNAVISIAGDFQTEEAMRLVQQHFGSIPRRQVPQWQDPGYPGQTAEQVEVMTDRLAQLPAFFVVYHIPRNREPDHYALELLSIILGDGESSRLNRLLVEERQVCAQVHAYTDGRRGPDLINFEGFVAAGHQPAEARALLYQEIDRVAREGVTPQELTKARNRARAALVFGLQTTEDRAQRLAEYEMYFGDAAILRTELGRYLAVTADDIRRVAATYLIASNRSVLDVVPPAAAPADEPAAPGQGATPAPAAVSGGEVLP